MSYIPPNAKWYIAEIVLKITVEDEPRSVVHTNFVLIEARSPDEALERAVQLGKEHEDSYRNPANRMVRIQFCGLRDLNVIHDELEHGAEITYQEEVGLSDSAIEKKVRPRDQLGVFRPLQRKSAPDYSSKEILNEAMKMVSTKGAGEPER